MINQFFNVIIYVIRINKLFLPIVDSDNVDVYVKKLVSHLPTVIWLYPLKGTRSNY